MKLSRMAVVATGAVGVLLTLLLHWQVFFWVPTERTMGVVQRIFYVHVPAAWIAFLAFGIVALCSVAYLWLEDERADWAAVSAAEGGMVFATLMLTSGPLWARVAWGTWWQWDEPRLILTLLLWFIYLGYFMVRSSTENVGRGRKLSAVVGIVGALTLPINHMSVRWFRGIHPDPVVLNPDGPTLNPDMLLTLMTGLLAFALLFISIFAFRYWLERATHLSATRSALQTGRGA